MEDLKRFINEIIEDKNTMHGTSYQETLTEIKKTISEIEEELQEQLKEELQEHLFYTTSLYNEWLEVTGEKRGISYGELAYLEELDDAELEKLDNELIEEIERVKKA